MVDLGHYYENGQSFFKVYAPKKSEVFLEIEGKKEKIAMVKQDDGYWIASCPELPEGTLYYFNIEGKRSLPDPASRCQPFGVHGLSMVVKPNKVNVENWHGVKISDAIIYEMHIGTFTTKGTINAASERIPYLAEIGINVIELMPINAFPGNSDWGYDGVYLFSIASSYGNYEDLKSFIEKAHHYGISVILDVVYNHFGPEGNYTGCYAPYTKDSQTPWGSAINFDQKLSLGIRDFYKKNVEWWIGDIGFDGMRLDAWAMIEDESESRIHRELVDIAHNIGKKEDRAVIMIAEHLRNDPKVVNVDADNCDSQWIDDFGLSIRAFLTPDANDKQLKSFYQFDDIITAMKQAIVLDGTRYNYVLDNYSGQSPKGLRPEQSVVYIQNHDMIGNRVLGDRFISTVGDAYKSKFMLAATSLFASPFRPMIFMGEEFACESPFPFFESFIDPYLINAVKEGRKREWKFSGLEPYDSHDPDTVKMAQLDWNALNNTFNQKILRLFSKLIYLKKNKIIGYDVVVEKGDEPNTMIIRNSISIVLLNFNDHNVLFEKDENYELLIDTADSNNPFKVAAFGAQVLIIRSKNLDLPF